jgi:predicted Rossmann-fold nucleotide-binding protein
MYGWQYWGRMIDWIRDVMLAEGYIEENDLGLFRVTDDPAEAANIIIYEAQEKGFLK